MKNPLFVKDSPIDEKRISLIERIVTRLTRRTIKVASAIITPYPISNCVVGEDVHGEILRYMFCAQGIISKGLILFGSKPKLEIKVIVSVENDIGSEAKDYIVTGKQILVEPNISVFSGDRLTISVMPVDHEEEKIEEVWISFLWVPHVSSAKLEHFLIEKLEEIGFPDEED